MSRFEAFTRAFDAALPAWPEGVAACGDALAALVASDELATRVIAELDAIARQPTRTPWLGASLHAWIMWRPPEAIPGAARGAKLTLARIAAGAGDDAGYLTDSPADQLVVPLGGAPLEVDLYAQDHAGDLDVMPPGLALGPPRRLSLRPGELTWLRARRDVLDILPQPEARYLLICDGPRRYTQQWVYSRAERRAVSAVAADPHDARLESGMRFLRVLGHTDGLAALARLAEHEAHFVRWSAIRTSMALDVEQGTRLLTAAVDDAHPHVRNAARRALSSAL